MNKPNTRYHILVELSDNLELINSIRDNSQNKIPSVLSIPYHVKWTSVNPVKHNRTYFTTHGNFADGAEIRATNQKYSLFAYQNGIFQPYPNDVSKQKVFSVSIPKRNYQYIDTSKLDVFDLYSMISIIVFKLSLAVNTTMPLEDDFFVHSFDNYVYVLVTEDKTSSRPLKLEEASLFISDLANAISDILKQIFTKD